MQLCAIEDTSGWHSKPKKEPRNRRSSGVLRCSVSFRSALAELPYLFGDCQALPKTPEKTEMVLRFPLGFA